MEWLRVQSIAELQELSKVKGKKNINNIRRIIKADLKNYVVESGVKDKSAQEMINITSNSWDKLYQKICVFRDMIDSYSNSNPNPNLDYFKSKEDELIFYILEMDGKRRSEKLGITRKCFVNQEEAKKWKNGILKCIHPDKTGHKHSNEAVAEINQLFEEMVGND